MKHKYIIIVGCGRLGRVLAHRFSLDGNSVVVIDNNADTFGCLSSDFSGFTIEGDATEVSVLQRAKLEQADVLFAATDNDNVNLMVSQVAKAVYNVKKVMARVKNPNREVIFHNLSIETICPTLLAVEEFIKQAKE